MTRVQITQRPVHAANTCRKMPTFKELDGRSDVFFPEASQSPRPSDLIAKRYRVIQRLGRGSFGCVYLVHDNKARDEELKVLKEIPLGDLRPNQTVHASREAQLLSRLHHPAILTFYSSFLERDSFCIITEYCQDRDLDCKLEEVREAGQSLPESQIIDWLIQLLLGLHYMHERRILHRDLKAKNIFLKRNLVKIGDFGVSCLLIGSCDLATTFTGTPYYMSPEVLNQQGYNSKSDIWALGCVLYEMCCLAHAFEGHSFLSVVMKIVEGETPTLPAGYSPELNSVMQRMLEKNPPSRISAEEALKTAIIENSMQSLKHKLYSATLKDKECAGERDAVQIAEALQKKVHLQTLRERSEVDRMTPRERMRLRKLEAADDKARRLRKLAEEKYQENHRRMQELRSRHFEKVSLDVFSENAEDAYQQTLPITAQDYQSLSCSQPIGTEQQDIMCMSEPEIPEDPQTAEIYYDQDGFESCSEEEQDSAKRSPAHTSELYDTCQQDSDLDAMIMHMEKVLQGEVSECGAAGGQCSPQGSSVINSSMVHTRIQRMRESVSRRLGPGVFQKVYEYLKEARARQESDSSIREVLASMVETPSDCFEVDQLLYYEERLQETREGVVGPARIQSQHTFTQTHLHA